MFGLIGHSTSFEDAKRKASLLGFDHIADGDLELMEEFMIAYQDTLMEIGLDNREIARMAMAAIV